MSEGNHPPLCDDVPGDQDRLQRLNEFGQGAFQVTTAVKSSRSDHRHRPTRPVAFLLARLPGEGAQVHEILRTRLIVAREQLQSNEMADRRDREPQAGQQFERLGVSGDLGFDARRGEQEIDDRAAGIGRASTAARCEQTPRDHR